MATNTKQTSTKEQRKGNAMPFRIASWILWALAIVCEIVAICVLNGKIYVEDDKLTMWLIIPLVVDFILVIVAGQLWKKGNDLDPASKANKFKFFVQNQLGLIMALVCFVPIIILLLTNKDLKGQTKKIVTIVAVVMLVIASLFSIDWNPVSAEERAAATSFAGAQGVSEVYWTRFGKSYHFDRDCQSLKNSIDSNIFGGSIDEAFDANRNDPCDFCVPQE